MIVYIEDCLIENFLVTFLILKIMTRFFLFKAKKLRIILASIFAGIIATFYPLIALSGVYLIVLKLLIGFLIINIAFKDKKYIAKYLIFIILTALYAGLNIFVYFLIYERFNIIDNFPTYILIFLLYLFYFFIELTITLLKKKLAISNFLYKIKIKNNNQLYIFNAFLDSGNSLLDQDSTPIAIINLKIFSKLYKAIKIDDLLVKNFKDLKNPHYVKSSFASGSAKILVFKIDELIIENLSKEIVFKDVSLGLSYSKFNQNCSADILLNINFFV